MIAWLSVKAFAGRALGFLKSLPWQVWVALAVAAAVFFGVRYHNGAVSDARKEGDRAGYTRASAEIVAKLKKLEDKANAIAANARKKNDETNRRIDSNADALRLQGPGKATCLRPASPSPRRYDPPARPGDAPVDQVPDARGDELIALPFADTIAFAEQHDKCRAEAMTWRAERVQQQEAWKSKD